MLHIEAQNELGTNRATDDCSTFCNTKFAPKLEVVIEIFNELKLA